MTYLPGGPESYRRSGQCRWGTWTTNDWPTRARQVGQRAEDALVRVVEDLLLAELPHVAGVGELDLLLVAHFHLVLLTLVVGEGVVEHALTPGGHARFPQPLLHGHSDAWHSEGESVTPAPFKDAWHSEGELVTPAPFKDAWHSEGESVTPAPFKDAWHSEGESVTPARFKGAWHSEGEPVTPARFKDAWHS